MKLRNRRSSQRARDRLGAAPEPEPATAEAGTLEENVLAFLDSGNEDDKLLFLEAVYSLMVEVKNPKPPSKRIYKAVFKCLEASQNLETLMAAYRLLRHDLDFPTLEVSIFLDSLNVVSMVENLEAKCNDDSVPSQAKAFVFEYMVHLLRKDFQRWAEVASGNGEMLENSFIYQQLPVPSALKDMLKNLILIIKTHRDSHRLCSDTLVPSSQALIALLFDLDELLETRSRKEAQHLVLEILHYKHEYFPSFLDSMENPVRKLELILKYFQNHGFKSAAKHTQDVSQTVCFGKLLQYVKDNRSSARSINKDLLQLLLAKAFQASMEAIPREDSQFAATVCGLIIDAFDVLFPDPNDLKPISKQALVVARTLIS